MAGTEKTAPATQTGGASAGFRAPQRLARMSMSATAELEQRVERMKAEGRELALLGLGEPDFAPPAAARQAAIAAIEAGFDRYTASGGIAELKDAIARKLLAVCGVSYGRDEVMASIGAKHVLFNAVLALLEEGDEAIVPMPYWVSFPEQIKFAGGRPILLDPGADGGGKLTAERLAAAVTDRTRLLILNSPNNPSGAAYTRVELEAIARVCIQRDLWVISDEVYGDFNFLPEGHASIAALPGMKERTVVVYSLSKGYGMPGWRLGFAAAPREVIAAMTMLQSHTTSNPPNMVQSAAVAALNGPPHELAAMRADYERRRTLAVGLVRQIPGFRCDEPDGAFYVWADVGAWIGAELDGRRIAGAADLCGLLLGACGTVMMPGEAFGSARHVRISFSASETALTEGLGRAADYLRGRAPAAADETTIGRRTGQ